MIQYPFLPNLHQLILPALLILYLLGSYFAYRYGVNKARIWGLERIIEDREYLMTLDEQEFEEWKEWNESGTTETFEEWKSNEP